MLRRRAKPSSGGTKQPKIALDHGHATIPSPFASPPKLFLAFSGEVSPERAEAVTSPTSILQAASPKSPATCGSASATAVPFSRSGSGSGDQRSKSHRHPWETKPVGLGLVGALNGEAPGDVASTVLTGQKLRVQTNYAPCSPSKEFGVKSRSGAGAPVPADHLVVQYASPLRCMSPREMEMSEDYTCVIARGPNPRTTHIFDNRVLESRGEFSAEWAASGRDDFLRYCHGCSKDLGQGKDIFMYRGERAFCSRECRYHEMLFDEGMEEF